MPVVEMFTAREILAVTCFGYHTKTGKHREGRDGTEELGPSFRPQKVSGQFRKEEKVGTMGGTKREKTMKGMQ